MDLAGSAAAAERDGALPGSTSSPGLATLARPGVGDVAPESSEP